MRRRDFIQIAAARSARELSGAAACLPREGTSRHRQHSLLHSHGEFEQFQYVGSRNQPNVYAIDGSFYFSVMQRRGSAGPDNPSVYQITRKGQLRVVTRECTQPNGVALAPNQQKLFVADTVQRNVRVFEVNGDGSLRNGRIFCELKGETPGGPDGLKTDEAGNVWVAGPGGIWVFDGSGKHLGTVPLPETPSNCAWGAGFRNLYVTAGTSVYRIETKVNGTRTY